MFTRHILQNTLNRISSGFRYLPAPVLLLFLFSLANTETAFGQNIEYTKGNTDSALRSDLTVDPSTLGMSLQIPLATYPGRGGALPVKLYYSSKQWRISFLDIFHTTITKTRTEAKWAEDSVAGWTTSLDAPKIIIPTTDYRGPYDGYGATICTSPSCNPPPPPETPIQYVNRMLVQLPDGSSHELRKDDQPTFNSGPDSGVYYAVDGSNIRYETATGRLLLPDGSYYSGGHVDRNGNKITFNSSVKEWADTLGRNIKFPLSNLNWGDVTNNIPGVNGTTLNYTLKWRYLHECLSSGQVRVIADYDYTFGNNPQPHTGPSLFTKFSIFEYVVSDGAPFFTTYFDPIVLKEIVLPNGKSYTFTYNIYGEINKVTLPTGGYERFAYGIVPGLDGSIYTSSVYEQANRGVTDRWVSVTGDGSDEALHHWTYLVEQTQNGPYVVRITDPNSVRSERLLHRASADKLFGYGDARTGMAYEERLISATGQMLRRTLTNWVTSGPIPTPPPGAVWGNATRNSRPTRAVEILLDTGGDAKAKTTEYQYDADLNVISKIEYGYVSINQSVAQSGTIDQIPNGVLLRVVETTYLVNDPDIDIGTRNGYRERNLITLPTKSLIKNGSNIVVAATQYRYDEGAYPLTTYPAVSGWVDPQTAYRGNVTTVRQWLDFNTSTSQPWNGWASGTWIETHTWYDQCGNPVKVRDGKNVDTISNYEDNFYGSSSQNTYAYLTSVTTSGPALTTFSRYDFNTGFVREVTDPNNVKTRYEYNDPLNRLTQTVRAEGTSVQNQTTIEYDDINRIVTTTGDRDVFDDNLLKSEALHDGLGRAVESRMYESASSFTVVNTAYDALGRPSQVTNPRRSGDPVLWTTTEYDSLGRIIKVTTPDGAHMDTAYNGNQVTVTDQAGKKRRSETDALGRLVKVIEDPDGSNYETTYLYDVLGNLRKVMQGAQTRWFAYDSLSRLIRARNPEQNTNGSLPAYTDPMTGGSGWSIAYSYDANGNLVSKTDARNITTSYAYDALNRNETVDYSDTTVNPDIQRLYDNPVPGSYGKGRFAGDYGGGTHSTGQEVEHHFIDSYDALGRPLTKRQHFKKNGVWSGAYSVSYTYDLAGNIKTVTYPSGRTVNYGYDQAGRFSNFTGNLGDGQLRTYSTIAQYHPAGLVERETFGTQTPLHHKKRYNNRLQLGDLRLSTGSDALSYDRGALLFLHGPNAVASNDPFANDPTNNGNLVKQAHYVPIAGGGEAVTQADTYAYDALNRISSVVEPNVFSQTYGYDRWGNRRITSATGNINSYNPTYDEGSNRIVGLGYDPAGNITSDLATGGTMTYDAENRLLTAGVGGGGTYAYDANGKRTRRTAGGQETWHIYGLGGELLAEYNANVAPSAPKKEYGYRGGQLLIIAEIGSNGEMVWVDDSLPLGATAVGDNDGWNWISASPSPFSGTLSHQSALVTGVHQHYFQGATPTLEINVGDKLYAYVYLDPANPPSTVMLQWNENGSWEHRAYWGANNIPWGVDGTVNMGALPAAGAWVKLEVPASVVGLEGKAINGIAFSLYGGRASWDKAGKTGSGGMALVTPASKSRNDIGKKTDRAVGGHESGPFVVDEPVADMEANEDSGSKTADISGSNNTGTQRRSSSHATAKEYGNDSFANGIERESFVNDPAGAQPAAPQQEYRARTAPLIVTPQSGGIVTVNPTAYQTPDSGQSGSAVTGQINTGHGSTTSSVLIPAGKNSGTQTKTALWHSFSGVSGTRTRVTLKFNWTLSASVWVNSQDEFVDAGAVYDFRVQYSLDNGSTWTSRVLRSDGVYVSGEGSDSDGIDTSGSESFDLPNPGAIDISQIRIRDHIEAQAYVHGSFVAQASANTIATVSGISLEVELADSTSPDITGVSSGTPTNTSATISWNTNENADSQVVYGPTQAYGQSTTLNPALVTAHSQGLSGLTPGTTYYYRVKSRDAAGNLATSTEFTFATVPPDTIAPVISNVASGATTTTATIVWTTNENSDSQVVYGPTQAYGQSTTLNPTLVTVHSQGLSGLTPGTIYYYRVKSKDAAGNLATSGELTLTTAQNGSATIKWLVTDHLGSTRMVIDETGSLAGIKRHDFLPFGEELFADMGVRSAGNGYGGDSVRQKFGSKERDIETGLDFFESRYFSSVQGRFVSPDDFAGGPTELFVEVAAHNPTFYADIFEPQSFNKYAYCLGNPLKFVDPDGHQASIPDRLKESVDNVKWAGREVVTGGLKELGNIYIGLKNASPFVTSPPTAYYEPNNVFQDLGMTVTEHITILGSFLGGKGPANVMMAEGEGAAVTTTVNLTSNAARRAAMQEVGIPTSQQPVPASQQIGPRTTAQGKNYEYDVPGKGRMAVQQTAKPGPNEPHGPHWEAGRVKPTGTTDALGRPRLRSDKSRVEYKPKKKENEN